MDGPHTLSIALSEPDATFLHALTMFFLAPVCKTAGSVYSRDFSVKPCGSGPFKVTHYENGQVIKLRRHEGYWQKGKPYLDGIDWFLTMQSFTQRFKFEDGALDYMRDFNDVDSLLFRTHPKWKGRGEWESAMTTAGAFMNTEMPPFDNRHVRRAVAFALNRDQIAMIRRGHVEPHYKIVPDAIIPDAPDYPKQRHDLDQALEEMRLAGYPYDPKTGIGGYPKEIPYIALLESMGQQAAVLYQQQLKKIGIRLRLQLVGWPTFLAKTSRRRTTPMGTAGWHADFAEAGAFFEPILTSRSILDDGAQNAAFFSNKKLDGLISDARRIVDPVARNRLYRQAEAIVRDEAPWATTYSYRYYELWQPYVHGYRPHPVASQEVRDMWFDAGGRTKTAVYMPCWRGVPHRHGCKDRAQRTTLAMVLGAHR